MSKNRIQIQVFREPGVLRIEHCTTGDRGCGFSVAAAIVAPGFIIGLVSQAVNGWNAMAILTAAGVSAAIIAVGGLLLGMPSHGSLRIHSNEFEVRGLGSEGGNQDRMAFAEIECLELANDLHRIPNGDECYHRGLHAVSGPRRICLFPNSESGNVRLVLDEILKAAPQLRSRVRWETLQGKL
jgi:hypothetical protein